jgi:hypothetical protein
MHLAKCRLVVHIAIPARTINWIDRQTSNLEVAGSSPATPAIGSRM